jgi:transcriptional antiterminator NusG
MQMEDKLNQVLVPTQEVAEIKGGKRKVSLKTSFPGYVLVQMDLDDDLWYVVKSTPGVMGFVGTGKDPIPLSDEEVEDILTSVEREPGEEMKQLIDISIGDKAKVIEGPFTGFSGVVDEINEEKSKLKLMISIFGRSTPVELEFFQVEKL